MSGLVEGWSLGENERAAWAQSPKRTIDVTVDVDALEVEIDIDGGPIRTATIPMAVLREVLRRVDAKGAK